MIKEVADFEHAPGLKKAKEQLDDTERKKLEAEERWFQHCRQNYDTGRWSP